jgi:hypothetical protein
MVTQRTQGLYRLFLLCQIGIVAALFWLGVWVMVTFYSKGAELSWRRYSVYCAMLVIGLLGESLSREGSKRYFLQKRTPPPASPRPPPDFRQCWRSRLLSGRDKGLVHFANFRLQLPPLALHRAPLFALFSAGIPRPRNLSPGRKDVARGSNSEGRSTTQLATAQGHMGLRTVGIICDEPLDCTEGRIPVLGGPDRFRSAIEEHGVTQVIMLEFPNSPSRTATSSPPATSSVCDS